MSSASKNPPKGEGQAASASWPRFFKSATAISPPLARKHPDEVGDDLEDSVTGNDYTLNIPDECLACIFHSLSSGNRKRSSLVCRRWPRVEGQSCHRLSLNAQSELASVIPCLFLRFDAVTKLALDRRSVCIGDDALIRLTQVQEPHEIEAPGLQKFSCWSCSFGAKGMNSLLENCGLLEELSVKQLQGITDGAAADSIGPGKAVDSLRVICLKDLDNGQCFGPLIVGAKNLRSLKLFRCSRDWDKMLGVVADRTDGLVEIHLERLQDSDIGSLQSQSVQILKYCICETVGDAEISCIAAKCIALRKLCIMSCPVWDHGIEALAGGCPNLVKVKVKKCRGLTSEGAEIGDADTPLMGDQNRDGNARSASFNRLRCFSGRSLVACTFWRWASFECLYATIIGMFKIVFALFDGYSSPVTCLWRQYLF
ncbi:putative F-box/LRR-repeat protein 8 [Sesamum alatum]|uniref:F-box/LRR-repeat protein 8 n=1 Tax=Sesamum alatum TaxID=300844 RepID=A0AAE1YRS7_9LAMI|nr:putative F-box/LRR-repeat protein 8 [Sesamum alatum]